jgi:hypothetical protein
MSKIRHHLDKSELAGFSKMGELDLMIRPSRLGNRGGMITKKGSQQDPQIPQHNKISKNVPRVPQKIGVIQEVKKNKLHKPMVFRKGHKEGEFNTFSTLKEDKESEMSSNEEDSFDLAKKKHNLGNDDNQIQNAQVFRFKTNKNTNTDTKVSVKNRNPSFQSYYKIQEQHLKEPEDQQEYASKLRKTGSVQIKFSKKKPSMAEQWDKRIEPQKAPEIDSTNLHPMNDQYEKVNIYKDSVYQENINRYLQKSKSNLSSQNSYNQRDYTNTFNPMKPDTNEDFLGTIL